MRYWADKLAEPDGSSSEGLVELERVGADHGGYNSLFRSKIADPPMTATELRVTKLG